MDRTLALFAIGLVFGGGIGFVVAAGNGITFDGHDHSDPAHHGATDHSGMEHAAMHDTPLDVPAEEAPTVDVTLTPDLMTGYNLHIMTDRFTFAPEAASAAHVPEQGHAHVYVNGVKLGRYYGPWVHIADLPKGEAQVQVTLNTNDHRVYATGGEQVSATATMTVE